LNLVDNQDKLRGGSVIVNKRDNSGNTKVYCRGGYVEPRGRRREIAVPNFQYADWRYAEAMRSLRQ